MALLSRWVIGAVGKLINKAIGRAEVCPGIAIFHDLRLADEFDPLGFHLRARRSDIIYQETGNWVSEKYIVGLIIPEDFNKIAVGQLHHHETRFIMSHR